MSSDTQQHAAVAARPMNGTRLAVFAAIVVGAFLLSYNYAAAQSGSSATGAGPGLFEQAAGGGCGMSGGGSSGGGCCGGGGPAVEAATAVEGEIQRIAVDTSTGGFNPNVIKAKAGVPIVLEFSQAPGGCLSGVYFPEFGIDEDLTAGSKTIELPALDPGEYEFFCQMQMVSAKIVVE